jgi:Tfp pilus assembly protein PilX
MTTSFRSERGSVLLVSLVFAIVIAIALTSYLQMSRTAMQVSQRAFLANDSMNVAEASLEQMLWSFNQANAGSTTAWTSTYGWADGLTTDDKRRTFSAGTFSVAQNAAATAKVYVKYYNSTGIPQPVAVVESRITPAVGDAIIKQVEVYLSRRSFFSTGLVAKNGVTFSGTNATVDSWNSDPDNSTATAAIPYSTTVRMAHGSVATTNITSTVSVQNADIFGYVSVGSSNASAVSLGSGGKITGDFAAASGTRDDTRVATNFTADLPDVTTPVGIASGDWIYFTETGNNNYITGAGHCVLPANSDINGNKWVLINGVRTYCYSVLYVNMAGNSSNALDIRNSTSGGVTTGYNVLLRVIGDVSTNGSAGINISAGSTLALYTAGNVDITGNATGNGGVANANGQAIGFQIWGTAPSSSSQTIRVSGNGALSATVYGPNADVSIVGNGEVYGAVVGKTIQVTGNANFHYDESLASFGGGNPFKVSTWRELRSATERQRCATELNF